MRTIRNLIFLTLVLLIINGQASGQTKVNPSIAVNGLIQYNLEFHNYGDSTTAGSEFRKAVLTAHGKVYKNIAYKVQLDFAAGTAGLRDVYIKFGKLPYIGGYLLAGSSIEPTGLDQYTGSKFKTFAERPIMASTQGFRWNPGFFYNNYSLLNGSLALQLAYTFNGDKNNGLISKNISKGGNFIARLTGNILKNEEKNRLIHIGARYEYRKREDGKYLQVFKPEVHMGEKFKFVVPKVNGQKDYGFEFAANYQSFFIQGEYELSTFTKGDKSNSISGYYGFIGFFPTGEHRSYKNSAFGMVVPKRNFCPKDGGFGAIELAIRYSAIDYSNSGGFLPQYAGLPSERDKINSITFGLNWYLNSHTRIIYNYITSDFKTGYQFNANLIKFQVKF